MRQTKTHKIITLSLLTGFLFCILNSFALTGIAINKYKKEVKELNTSIKTDSYYVELEEDEDNENGSIVLKSVFLPYVFFKINHCDVSFINLKTLSDLIKNLKAKNPRYLVINVLRV